MTTGRSAGKWHRPDSAFTVEYSVPVFHEIDALVSEGFRRIPRGGIEHGGLLFGMHHNDGVEIRAFRQIECEHSEGPGFSLSSNDLEGLQQQLDTSDTDRELSQLLPVGLFVSHSRRDLRLTNDEVTLFRLLFPETWHLLLVVKPDRFKPTNFVFVFANEEDLIGTDLAARAFVLPMPGPEERLVSREPGTRPIPVPHSDSISVEDEEEIVSSEARILPVEDIRVAEAPAEARIGEFQADADVESEHIDARPTIPSIVRPPSGDSTRVKRWLRTIAVSILAALVAAACCLRLFSNYVEQPIELHARKVPSGIVVSWPSSETKATDRASLRIWDGGSAGTVILSAAQKESGQGTVAVSADDVTIELIVHRWMRERRGVIRVLLSDK